MADFYSPMLTENADGTLTSTHSLGKSQRFGLSRKAHASHLKFPAGRTLAIGDKLVFVSVPTDFKPVMVGITNGPVGVGVAGAGVSDLGVFKINDDGSVGDKVSPGSHQLFGGTLALSGFDDKVYPRFTYGVLSFEHEGLQLWQLINVADPGTYTENPGGMFCIASEITTATTTVSGDSVRLEIEYSSMGD